MSRAGQADEVGSVFRCAVATHLAVYGLRSHPVPGLDLPIGVDPVRLEFETSDPTDDIRVTFSDGRRAYVSAKRKVTRGRPLAETVDGWIAQAPMLGPDDILVLAGEEFAGPAKNFDRALRRHRAGLSMETKDERVAFASVADLLPERVRGVILNRARILHLPDSTGAGASRSLLAALMDFAVDDTQGHQAVSTLADLFHRQAGEALGSGIEDWVVALSDAGLTVIADRGGPAGMRAAARLAAVSTYRDRLSAEAGRIDLSLLAEDLPPIVVNDLVDGLEIDIETSRTHDDLLRHLRRCAPWVAQQLADILDNLHPRVGFVLATRASAETCAVRLGLPRVELASPRDLSHTVDSVLVACAEARVPKHQRDEWLATRRAWIREAKDQHDHLLTVPLLAILLALICANASDADLPKGRATLLHQAVEQSVQRWEQSRATLNPAWTWSPTLTTAMLLQGFIVLGRILDGGATPMRADALGALRSMLQDPDHWAMPPAQASEVAKQVLRFWDEHVAVFVVNAADELTTRSKVFSEIATAMWATGCEQAELTSWLAEAIAHTDSDGAIALAAGLDPRVVGSLLDVGASDRLEATFMVADLAIRGIAMLTPSESERTIGQLAAGAVAARDGEQPTKRGPKKPHARLPKVWDETREPGPWPFVQSACQLPLPAEHRRQRADLIAQAKLDDRSATIAAALCELTDATTDGGRLTETGVASVLAALAIPLPPEAKMVQESRRRFAMVGGGQLTPGLSQIALAAANRLNELANDSGERAFQIAMQATHGYGERIFAALNRAGFDTSRRWADFAAGITSWLSAHQQYEAALFADLGSLAGPASGGDTHEFWSLTDVGDLLAATGYQDVAASEFNRAFVHDDAKTRRAWLDALADAYVIDKSAVARQARHLREMSAEAGTVDGVSRDWFVASAKPVVEPALREDLSEALTTEHHETLVSCLEADSDWIAWAAGAVLSNLSMAPTHSRTLFKKDMSAWPRSRASLLYMVAILSAGDEREKLLADAVASELADYRCAARMAISAAPDLDPDGSIAEALRRDPDLSVRPKGGRKEPPSPVHWTCNKCRSVNDLDVEDCPKCEEGVRPDA